MRDLLTFTFGKGYFDNGSVVEVPDGSIIPPSVNVLYDKNGRLMSFGGLLHNYQFTNPVTDVSRGGTRAFLLDRDVVGFLGKMSGSTVIKANGNMIQSVGKSLWFVGNDLTDSVRAVKLNGDTVTQIIEEEEVETPVYKDLSFGGIPLSIRQPIYNNSVEPPDLPEGGQEFVPELPPPFPEPPPAPEVPIPVAPDIDATYNSVSTAVDISVTIFDGSVMRISRSLNGASFLTIAEYDIFNLPSNTAINFSDTDVSAGNYYYYRAEAASISGSSFSETVVIQVGITPTPGTLPQVPKNLTAVPTSTTLALEWEYPGSEPSGLTYTVQWSEDGETIEEEDGITDTEFEITGLESNTLHSVRVKSVLGTLSSDWITGYFTTTVPSPPPAPVLDDITSFSDTAAVLNWTWSKGSWTGIFKHFLVERKLGAGSFSTVTQITDSLTSTYIDDELAASSSYTYRITAVSTNNDSTSSNEEAVTTTATPTITINAPSGLTAETVYRQPNIVLEWVDNSDNELGFEVWRTDGDGVVSPSYARVGSVLPAGTITFTDTTTQFNTEYTYKVRAVNGSVQSLYSTPVTITSNPVPEPLKVNLTVTSSSLPAPTTVSVNHIPEYNTLAGQQTLMNIFVTEIRKNEDISKYFYVTPQSATIDGKWGVILTAKNTSVSANSSSTLKYDDYYNVPGVVTPADVDYTANLSKIPQFAKWIGEGWSTPLRVGLPEIEETIILDFEVGVEDPFQGLIQGSRSVRVARKRIGGVSIASRPSNIVTVPEEGGRLKLTIPVIPPDGSDVEDNTWLLYFTYKGLGSTATHKLFPLEIPEIKLRGLVNNTPEFFGNAKYLVGNDREVTVEFTDADLLAIDPLDDAFPAEECKFIAKLGNVMCLIGTGDDQTGFDVSIPNNFEGYNPEWRDWLAEVPVSIAVEQDLGFFWVLTSNTVYMAEWTGVTEGAAPVILRKTSSLQGAIGEGASVCVNGMLYFLSRGKTPIILSPTGQVNGQIGAAVQRHFALTHQSGVPYYDENTQVSWDEATNSVIFSGNGVAIALQLATGLWSAPITTSQIYALVPVNGFLNCCIKSGNQFRTSVWNMYDIGSPNSINWQVTSNFQFGKSGRALKDIIQVESIFSSPYTNVPLTFGAYKNFDTYTPFTLTDTTVGSTIPMITVREYTESLDYDCIAAALAGTKGGQTVHTMMYTVHVHAIERQG